MKSFAALLLFGMVFLVSSCSWHQTSPDIAALGIPEGQDRFILVLNEETGAPQGSEVRILAFSREGNTWREVLNTRGFAGRNGIGVKKREGDGLTPSGTYALRRAFGLAENPGTALEYEMLRPGDVWVDDPESRFYNMRARKGISGEDWKSAEDLPTEDVAYKYAVVIEYNTEPVIPGAGSAIFLHCSKGKPTAGCVSMPEKDMLTLLRFLHPGDSIYIRPTSYLER